jgi:hypothetical protein
MQSTRISIPSSNRDKNVLKDSPSSSYGGESFDGKRLIIGGKKP